MKKLLFLLFSLLAIGAMFQACSDSKTYAEQLADERDAIRKYIEKHKIKVISVQEFEKDTITRCREQGYPGENEYVLFSDGVYMQILNRGTGDSIKDRDEILVRFLEYDIMYDDTTSASNYNLDGYVDSFYYSEDGYSSGGKFVKSWLRYYYYNTYGLDDSSVPSGWLLPIRYIRHGAHVKLIVPSKSGHQYASKYVNPFFYDMRSIRIY